MSYVFLNSFNIYLYHSHDPTRLSHELRTIVAWWPISSGKPLWYYIIDFPVFWECHAMEKWCKIIALVKLLH